MHLYTSLCDISSLSEADCDRMYRSLLYVYRSLGLLCIYIRLFVNYPLCPGPTVTGCIGLFCMYLGLFCMYIGVLCMYIRVFVIILFHRGQH